MVVKRLTASVQRLFASSMVTSTAVTTSRYKDKIFNLKDLPAARIPDLRTLCSPWQHSYTRPCSSATLSGCQRRRPWPVISLLNPKRLSQPVKVRSFYVIPIFSYAKTIRMLKFCLSKLPGRTLTTICITTATNDLKSLLLV